ncbi:late embryogenesis abundant protein lea5 [Phtheirospermum japonicum]|uniref:Late embryogenesis abundant protein lea5 n=1 Tax=Phtheirospermum japonicum TaxID=374723 RepID=A0A830AZY0_9LAMI|nr:late embryogenesis abundant protein lea5 [Phtheirospermum japonicum]
MARSFSNAKTVSAFITDKISAVVARRGYAAAASQGSTGRTGASNLMFKKGAEESAKTSWVPDPVTGYYRPENQAKEIDAAELRAMMLKTKIRGN